IAYHFVESRSLRQRLGDGGRLPPREAAALVARLARAVGHAHRAKGLIHRDIKPENVLVDGDGAPHLTDFGLALLEAERDREPHGLFGTVEYMAPEQLTRDPLRIDHRTDVYALGVLLYEALAGKRPFLEGAGPAREAVPLRSVNPRVPRRLSAVCERALAPAPGRRYASAEELAQALERYLAGAGRPLLLGAPAGLTGAPPRPPVR